MIAAILAALKLRSILGWAIENWKAVAIGALVLAVPVGYTIGHWRGDNAGYARHKAEIAVADAKAAAARSKDNEVLRNSSDYDLCVGYLRAQRLPVDDCEQLRGVQP